MRRLSLSVLVLVYAVSPASAQSWTLIEHKLKYWLSVPTADVPREPQHPADPRVIEGTWNTDANGEPLRPWEITQKALNSDTCRIDWGGQIPNQFSNGSVADWNFDLDVRPKEIRDGRASLIGGGGGMEIVADRLSAEHWHKQYTGSQLGVVEYNATVQAAAWAQVKQGTGTAAALGFLQSRIKVDNANDQLSATLTQSSASVQTGADATSSPIDVCIPMGPWSLGFAFIPQVPVGSRAKKYDSGYASTTRTYCPAHQVEAWFTTAAHLEVSIELGHALAEYTRLQNSIVDNIQLHEQATCPPGSIPPPSGQ